MNKSSFTYIVFILSSFILTDLFYSSNTNIGNGVAAIDPPESEYQCWSNFVDKFNLVTTYPKNSSGYYEVCTYFSCHNNGSVSILYASNKADQVPLNAQVLVSDLACFPYVHYLGLSMLPLSDEILYDKINPVAEEISLYSFIFTNPIYKKLAPYKIISIQAKNVPAGSVQNLKSSYISHLNTFRLYEYPTILEIDSESLVLKELIIGKLLNLPKLNGFNFVTLQLTFLQDNGVISNDLLNNFQSITATNVNFLFGFSNIPFYLNNSYNILSFMHTGITSPMGGHFITPSTQTHDLSATTNFKYLKISGVSNSLFFNNQIALKLNSNTNLIFKPALSNNQSDVIGFPDLSANFNGKNKYYQFQSSRIVASLPSYSSSGLFYDFTDNQLTGTIDSSWCDTNLIITNNNLTGTIPSCFTCHFSAPSITLNFELTLDYFAKPYQILPDMKSRFAGNQFTNYDSPPPCTTMKPRVSYYNQSTIIISGQDIGFNIDNFRILYIDGSYIKCKDDIGAYSRIGYEYYCNIGFNMFNLISYVQILFYYNQLTYTFPLVNNSPTITSVLVNSGIGITSFSLVGLYFSSYQGHTNQSIQISNYNCAITFTNFTNIECTIIDPLDTTPAIKHLSIAVGNQVRNFIINTNSGSLNNKVCSIGCSNDYSCDLTIGQCFPTCPNKCFNGYCNGAKGSCECNQDYYGESCQYKQCKDPTCSNNGICDTNDGICECSKDWFGQNCSTPIHYVTSVIPSDENGGNATFYGYFGSADQTPSVTIGSNDCPVLKVSNQAIVCNAPPGKGTHNYNITQNGLSKIGINLYKYSTPPSSVNNSSTSYTCPNDCSNNGKCNSNGLCECYIGYALYDCSSLSSTRNISNSSSSTAPPETKLAINKETASINLNNEQTNFKIYLKSLYEVDVNGNTIKEYPLTTDWTVNISISNIYTFIQHPIQDNSNFAIKSTIEIITSNEGKQFNFADTIFKLDKDSIKFTISIQNYPYQSYLNTLKLDIISNTSTTDQSLNYNNNNNNQQCNNKDTKLETSTNNQLDLAFIKISKDNKVMMGRFINKVISDGRSTYLSTQTSTTSNNQSIIVTLNLPLCINECLIDPDFSVLVSSDYKSKCDDDSDKDNNKWILPVAIVVPCVSLIIIITIGAVLYTKNRTSLLAAKGNFVIKLNKIKRKNSIFMDHTRK